jgi:hypothetical protein
MIIQGVSRPKVVPPGFEPRSEEPESSMMDRYTKGLWSGEARYPLQLNGKQATSNRDELKEYFRNP